MFTASVVGQTSRRAPVRSRINSLSNSAIPAKAVIILPVCVVVLAQGSSSHPQDSNQIRRSMCNFRPHSKLKEGCVAAASMDDMSAMVFGSDIVAPRKHAA